MSKELPPPDEAVRLMKLASVIDHFREVDPAFPVSYIAALLAVAREPGLSGTEYAKQLGHEQAPMSRMLLELGQKSRHGGPGRGWLYSVTDSLDLRRKHIYLTDEGKEIVRKVVEALR